MQTFFSHFSRFIIKDIIILRLELHISSCSRKNVYYSLDKLSDDDLYETYDKHIMRRYEIDINYKALEVVKNYFN